MADILIKGLKLPEGANELRLIIHPNGQVIISKQTYWEETEAIEVPDHGRLIDADQFYEDVTESAIMTDDFKEAFAIWLETQEAVIPASEEET